MLKITDNKRLNEHVYIGIVYIPPENSDYFSDECFNEIENDVNYFMTKSKYVFLLGDTNARTASAKDYNDPVINSHVWGFDADTEGHMNYIMKVSSKGIPITRYSQDKVKNSHGNKLLELCKISNMYICNGRLGNDCYIGKCTSKETSLIDYLLSTSDGMGIIENFTVHDFCPILSDIHCSLLFDIAISDVLYKPTNRIQRPRLWDKEKKSEFINNVNLDHVNDLYLCINTLNHNPIMLCIVNSMIF